MKNWGCGTWAFAVAVLCGGLLMMTISVWIGTAMLSVLICFFIKAPPPPGGY